MSLTSIFQDIADAIRTKTGKSESIYPVDMASEIEGISSGGGYKLEKMPSGAVSSFNDGTDLPLNKLKVSIEPVQDLHGYDAPWAGGAGKNKFNKDTVTLGKYLTNTGAEYINQNGSYSDYIPIITNTPYYFSHIVGASSFYSMCIYDESKTFLESKNILGNTDSSGSVTFTQGAYIRVNVYQPKLDICQIELGSTATDYAPYSNICPISGWDEVNVTVANDVDNPTISNVYTFDLDGTHYGGTLDVVSGVLTVTNANIVSYNGEIINEPWISSMDVYSAGATPTTGAQVVYPLAIPQTIQLTPTAVRSLIELNNIWADAGDIINGEYFKGADTRSTS